MEDFKLKEQFPIKLFEILEEKLHSKELTTLTVLSQTKYFKKLLEQTYNMRKQAQKGEALDAQVYLTIDLVDKKMLEIGEFVDSQLNGLIKGEGNNVK